MRITLHTEDGFEVELPKSFQRQLLRAVKTFDWEKSVHTACNEAVQNIVNRYFSYEGETLLFRKITELSSKAFALSNLPEKEEG